MVGSSRFSHPTGTPQLLISLVEKAVSDLAPNDPDKQKKLIKNFLKATRLSLLGKSYYSATDLLDEKDGLSVKKEEDNE